MNFTDHKPDILSLQNESDLQRYKELLKQQGINRIDTIDKQLKEWVQIQHTDKLLTDEQINEITKETLGNLSLAEYGNWVYYPWLNSLVHLLPEAEFVAVRTNRNKLKITTEEQTELAQKRIGIIGMSVGQAVAVTCAMERVAGEIRIADFDTLDLSNLNRLRAGVYNLGQNKAIIAARAIAEIDPYIKVSVFSEGINDVNIEDFFTANGNIDALIEVCDGLDVKIKSRKMARSLNIPVIMDTNDRGMLDIERFDKEPTRPLFHGLVNENELDQAHTLASQQRVAMLMRLVSFENTSQRLKISMGEIGKTIRTWPQLASSVQAGAGFTCETVRRILLKAEVPSGRFYIDTEEIIKTA